MKSVVRSQRWHLGCSCVDLGNLRVLQPKFFLWVAWQLCNWAPIIPVRSIVAPFRCLTAMPPEVCTRTGILPGCPSLDRVSPEAEVEFEPRTFRSVNSRCNHLGHLVTPIIIDSMMLSNTEASLPYNHGLFESLIVKKKIKSPARRSGDRVAPILGGGTSSTDSTQTFPNRLITFSARSRIATSTSDTELSMKNSTLRQTMVWHAQYVA
ncbi:hypothetical protein CSKR_103892 [Clonorchis sinensis]|uniref:Uncharacterized protein n=1 Tax=Clonorchis sinensis TaxID=79923 RepID=A0A3R7CXP5_CLOSI|nr:hypothetical protein CSKR_103892 [Clonorchis sinensis]